MRIIQRNTANYTLFGGLDFWLYVPISAGYPDSYYLKASEENIDLKVDYRTDSSLNYIFYDGSMNNRFVIKLYALHYPVSIYFINEDVMGTGYNPNYLHWKQFNEENGLFVEGTFKENDVPYHTPFLLQTFNNASENNLLLICILRDVSIEDAFYENQY